MVRYSVEGHNPMSLVFIYIQQMLLSKAIYSNSYIHSYTDGGDCHTRCRQAHQEGFSILPKDTSACRHGESNQRPSNNMTLALPLGQSTLVVFWLFLLSFVFQLVKAAPLLLINPDGAHRHHSWSCRGQYSFVQMNPCRDDTSFILYNLGL